jgi:hypothetical protein
MKQNNLMLDSDDLLNPALVPELPELEMAENRQRVSLLLKEYQKRIFTAQHTQSIVAYRNTNPAGFRWMPTWMLIKNVKDILQIICMIALGANSTLSLRLLYECQSKHSSRSEVLRCSYSQWDFISFVATALWISGVLLCIHLIDTQRRVSNAKKWLDSLPEDSLETRATVALLTFSKHFEPDDLPIWMCPEIRSDFSRHLKLFQVVSYCIYLSHPQKKQFMGLITLRDHLGYEVLIRSANTWLMQLPHPKLHGFDPHVHLGPVNALAQLSEPALKKLCQLPLIEDEWVRSRLMFYLQKIPAYLERRPLVDQAYYPNHQTHTHVLTTTLRHLHRAHGHTSLPNAP